MTEDCWFHELQKTFDWGELMKTALSQGGEWSELFWERSDSTVIRSQARRIEELSSGIDEGAGLRVLVGGRTVYGFTNNLTPEGFLELARQVATGVRAEKTKVSWNPSLLAGENRSPIVSPLNHVPVTSKLELVRRFEKLAWETPNAIQVRTMLADRRRRVFVARSDGILGLDDKCYVSMRGSITGEKDGLTQSVGENIGGLWGLEHFEQESPEQLATRLNSRLQNMLKAVAAPSGTLPVVLAGRAGGTLCHEAVGHGLEADLAEMGLSVYAGRLGQKVASDIVTVIDDATLPHKRGTHVMDDEGTVGACNVLIEKGVLKSYMYDQKMALRKNRTSTGNGRRQSYMVPPMVRMTNTFIAPGTHDADKILRETPEGLYVAQMGGGQVDTVTGNFVFAVTEAYLIRHGELAEAVRGATLIGNGPKVLQEVDRVAGDLGFSIGMCGKNRQSVPVSDAQPTMRVPHLTVGGTVPASNYFTKHK